MVRIFCGSAIGKNWKTGKNVSRHGSISLHNYTDTNLRNLQWIKYASNFNFIGVKIRT